MELAKYKKFLKDDNYVHCSICRNYRNSNSFGHRKSKDHQKRLAFKLRKIAFHLTQKKKKEIIIHDEHWPERICKRYCHFCSKEYDEHHQDDEFTVENLGSLYHHANSEHVESVKVFLKNNFCDNKVEKYCIQQKDLNSFLEKLPEAKKKYLKKMEILNNMVLNQIKKSEEERKILIEQTQAETSDSSCAPLNREDKNDVTNKSQQMQNIIKKRCDVKVPPWLEDVPNTSTVADNSSSAPVIGPTMDNLIKYVANQKKKGLSKNRIGANFKHKNQGSSKWLPSFQGVWNQGRRKQLQIQFKRKNPAFN